MRLHFLTSGNLPGAGGRSTPLGAHEYCCSKQTLDAVLVGVVTAGLDADFLDERLGNKTKQTDSKIVRGPKSILLQAFYVNQDQYIVQYDNIS